MEIAPVVGITVIFDFEPWRSRSSTVTVTFLAHMAHLITVYLTETDSVPFELQNIIINVRAAPIISIKKNLIKKYNI